MNRPIPWKCETRNHEFKWSFHSHFLIASKCELTWFRWLMVFKNYPILEMLWRNSHSSRWWWWIKSHVLFHFLSNSHNVFEALSVVVSCCLSSNNQTWRQCHLLWGWWFFDQHRDAIFMEHWNIITCFLVISDSFNGYEHWIDDERQMNRFEWTRVIHSVSHLLLHRQYCNIKTAGLLNGAELEKSLTASAITAFQPLTEQMNSRKGYMHIVWVYLSSQHRMKRSVSNRFENIREEKTNSLKKGERRQQSRIDVPDSKNNAIEQINP
jgi:hypothetical protein